MGVRESGRSVYFVMGLALVASLTRPVCADIYQWEYVDPSDPSQGKQKSTTLTPGGAGVDAVPMSDLRRDLTMAYLIDARLTGTVMISAILNDADLSGADLTRASLKTAEVAGAVFTGATITRTNLTGLTDNGFTEQQLMSTASYQAGNLSGVIMTGNDMTGWNFSG